MDFIQGLFSHGVLFPILLIAALIIFLFMLVRFVYFFVWFLLFLVVAAGALSLYDREVGTAIKEVFVPTQRADNTVPTVWERLITLKDKLQNLSEREEAKQETPPPPAPAKTENPK